MDTMINNINELKEEMNNKSVHKKEGSTENIKDVEK